MLAVLAEDASSVGKVVFPAFLWPSRPPAGLEARATFEAGRARILQPASTARGDACTRGGACMAAIPKEMWLPLGAQGPKAMRRTSPERYVVCS